MILGTTYRMITRRQNRWGALFITITNLEIMICNSTKSEIIRQGRSSSNDLASMETARDVSKTAVPTKKRDGFELIPANPILYDIDLTSELNFCDITYKISSFDHCARMAFNRPHVLHAFRPTTINELRCALDHAQDDVRVATILLSSEIYPEERTPAFCSGGDQSVRSSDGGYIDGSEDVPRLRVLDLQVQMRRCPKPIIAVVRGYAIGGGHILHMVSHFYVFLPQ